MSEGALALLAVLLSLGLPAAVASWPAAPPSLAKACWTGCAVAAGACNTTDPRQLWRYDLGAPASLGLAAGQENATAGLCLNVQAYGVAAGDRVWVTLCHPERPLRANEGWAFNRTSAQLLNPRSQLCAVVAGAGGVVLGPCADDQQWRFDPQTGQVIISGAWPGPERCLATTPSAAPSPGPRPPSGPSGPATVRVAMGAGVVFTVRIPGRRVAPCPETDPPRRTYPVHPFSVSAPPRTVLANLGASTIAGPWFASRCVRTRRWTSGSCRSTWTDRTTGDGSNGI